jgi:hypothetical protein
VRSWTAKGSAKRVRRDGAPLALVLVLVHLAGTVGGHLHFALVEHERCPEHGELIHAPTGDHASEHAAHADAYVASTASSRVPDEHHASLLPNRGLSHGSHDSCALTTALRERATEPGPSCTGVTQPPRVGALPSLDSHRYFTARAAYRVAPKTSPPERA